LDHHVSVDIANGAQIMKKSQTSLELPADLYERLTSIATAENVAVPTLLERMVGEHRPVRPVPVGLGATILGEAVGHEEIHVWDRPHDDSFAVYVGDYAD
jgi:hypothetical protein